MTPPRLEVTQLLPMRRVLLILIIQLLSCQSRQLSLEIKTHSGHSLKLRAEVASTPRERERGLMFREKLPEGEGMIFIFPERNRTSFWMKDTPLSLDMIFICDHQIVDIIEKAAPYSLKLQEPRADYNEVLEVPGGFAAKNQILIGDTIQ